MQAAERCPPSTRRSASWKRLNDGRPVTARASSLRRNGSLVGDVHASAPVAFPHVALEDGEEHELGNVRITVLHPPGHTPDGVCLVVTDRTRGPEPWFVLTGDTLFAGGVGRPDLLGHGAECF